MQEEQNEDFVLKSHPPVPYMLGLAGILLSPSYLARVGAVLDDILQRGGISSLSTRGWYFNAHLLKHDFCSQFSRLADKETAEGRHLLSLPQVSLSQSLGPSA